MAAIFKMADISKILKTEICHGQVHGPRKERKKERKRIIIIIIIIITRYDYNITIMKSHKPATDNSLNEHFAL